MSLRWALNAETEPADTTVKGKEFQGSIYLQIIIKKDRIVYQEF